MERIRQRITAAANRTGRNPAEIQLIAVTKYVALDVAREAAQLGCLDLGESRPQQLWSRADALPDVRWHLIGSLQTNKVAKTISRAYYIHSCDSVRLYDAIKLESHK